MLDLRELGLPELSVRVRVARNLCGYKLPGAMSVDERLRLEGQMCLAFEQMRRQYGGGYHSLTPGHPNHISDTEYQCLVEEHAMFQDMSADPYLVSAGIAADWPLGRGCYISAARDLIIWVNEEDHLRIICMHTGFRLDRVIANLKSALDTFESLAGVQFAVSERYGYLTSCPTNLGSAMRASVHLKCPNLTADGTAAACAAVCKPLGLSVRGVGGEHTPIGAGGTVDISPSARFCTGAQIITKLYDGVASLVKAEARQHRERRIRKTADR